MIPHKFIGGMLDEKGVNEFEGFGFGVVVDGFCGDIAMSPETLLF